MKRWERERENKKNVGIEKESEADRQSGSSEFRHHPRSHPIESLKIASNLEEEEEEKEEEAEAVVSSSCDSSDRLREAILPLYL